MDMKAKTQLLILLLLGSLALPVGAITRYVDLNGTSPTPPYTSWSTAAANINDAIDAATTNDLILVTNGIYQNGGRVVTGTMTNRVAITKPVIVSSVNGPAFTIIQGAFDPVSTTGDSAVQCVYLASEAVLTGFTIINGATQQEFWGLNQTQGGGVWCESTNAVVTNCVITGNAAYTQGGGVYRGTIMNCILRENTANTGGGASGGRLVNCLLYGNWARGGGGASECILVNCSVSGNGAYPGGSFGGFGAGVQSCSSYNSIIYYNTNASGDPFYENYSYTDQLTYCCTTPLPPSGLNITANPLFIDALNGNVHLQLNSPCINAGNNSYVLPGFALDGNARIIDGSVDMGAFEVPANAHAPITIYVDVSGTNPIPPYTNWATAATVIQDASDVSQAGDKIVVTNGVYKIGGKMIAGVTNRVVLINSVSLRSVNGPTTTIIEGFQVPGTIVGESAIRCAYLGNGAVLTGFTLTNGATPGRYDIENPQEDVFAAGVWCQSTSEIVSNCVIINNRSDGVAGGIYRGTVYDSMILSNSAFYGGGADSSVLSRCVLRGNAASYGAGANGGILANCLLIHNSGFNGGGARNATLSNCTISANEATGLFEGGGGVYGGMVKNCIIYANIAPAFPNHYFVDANYCCTFPLPTNGTGNFTNAPLFVDLSSDNLRLHKNSPCIDSGSNADINSDADLDGRQRLREGVVDIGAYEFQGTGMGEFIRWLQGFGIPTDGSADFTDTDGDRMNNYNEWRTDTNPTNEVSLLRMVSAINGAGGTLVTWQSSATRSYTLERSTNLGSASPFQTIATNIAGAADMKTFNDTSATNSGAYFYRVGVE